MSDIIRVDVCDNSALVTFLQNDLKLDLDVLNDLDSVIQRLYKENVFNLSIDFYNVMFITSLVLGKLVSYHRDLSKQGGGLSISNTNQSVMDVFSLTKIDRIISVS